jgi:uncharacterized membrane protein (Fun14 family)
MPENLIPENLNPENLNPENLVGPLAGLGFGGMVGAVVGYAAKKMTKVVAIGLGVIFVLMQTMVYLGWIEIDWAAMQTSAEGAWTDAQGQTLAERVWPMLTHNLPFGGGFVVGFALGFKLG